MTKVLVLNGSPKQKSDTMVLTRAFLQGMQEEADFDIQIVNVIEKEIKPCLGCFACWKIGDGNCVQKDDQNAILAAYREADILVWSFPLYCYSMPSHLKALLDRTIPLVQMKMVEVDGRVQHVPLVDFSRKSTLVICGCGFPDWEGNFDGLRLQCQNSFGNLSMVCVPETPLLNVEAAQPLTQGLLEAFVQAGGEYARERTLSQKTIQRLETPMMPREVYLANVNGTQG